MKKNVLHDWMKRIRETEPEEASCSECFDFISSYVEYKAAGEDAEAKLPRIRQHLVQCQVCHEEYELLLNLATMENQGNPSSVAELRHRIEGEREED